MTIFKYRGILLVNEIIPGIISFLATGILIKLLYTEQIQFQLPTVMFHHTKDTVFVWHNAFEFCSSENSFLKTFPETKDS